MKKRYTVVTVGEGGADFDDYEKWSDVPFTVSKWSNTDGGVKVRSELKQAKIGDEIDLDGNSTCFVLKALIQ